MALSLPHDHGDGLGAALERMPPQEDIDEAALTFRQLGDGTRLKILWLLCHSRECVSNIAAAVGMSPAAVSHHIQLLRRSGLIVGTRAGREIRYRLAGDRKAQLLHEAIDAMFDVVCPAPRRSPRLSDDLATDQLRMSPAKDLT